MPELTDDYLDFRDTTNGAVRSAQALPTEIYLEVSPTTPSAAPSVPYPTTPPAPPETPTGGPAGGTTAPPPPPTAETPTPVEGMPTPGAPPALPQLLKPPTAQDQVVPLAEAVWKAAQATETGRALLQMPGVGEAARARVPADLGMSRNAMQALVAYLPTGQATPLLQQAASGLDLFLNLTMIPATFAGAVAGGKVDPLAPLLARAGIDAKPVADAVQVTTELAYGLFQNAAGAITPSSIQGTLAAARVIGRASVKLTQLLRDAPEVLFQAGRTVARVPKTAADVLRPLMTQAVERGTVTAEAGLRAVTEMEADAVTLADVFHVQPEDAAHALVRGERIFRGLPSESQLVLQSPAMVGRLILGAVIGGYTGDTAEEQVRHALIGMGLALSPEAVRLVRKGMRRELRAMTPPVTTPQTHPLAAAGKTLGITTATPIPPGQAWAGGPTTLGFDFERIAGDPAALWTAVDDLVTRRGRTVEAPNFGELTKERIDKLIDVTGLRPDELMPGEGRILNVQQLDAAADVTVAALTELLEKNALVDAAQTLGMPADQLARLVEARDQHLVWAAKIATRVFEVAGEIGSSLRKWQDLLPVIREPMGKARDLAALVERGLVGSDLVTQTLTKMTDQPTQTAGVVRKLWNQGWKVAGALFQSSLLTGLEAINILGNATMTAMHLTDTVVAAARSTLKGAAPGERVYFSEFPVMLYGASLGLVRGLGAAVRLFDANMPTGTLRAGVDAFRAGQDVGAAMRTQARHVVPSAFGTSKVTFDKTRAVGSEDFGISGVFGLAADMIGQLAYTGHTMTNASDEVFKFMNVEMVRYQEALRHALDKGLRNPAEVRLFMRDFLTNTPKAVEQLAQDTSNLLTLTNPLAEYATDVRKALAHPAFKFIAPFWTSPLNAQRYNFAHLPGLGRIVEYQQRALTQGGRAAELAKARMNVGAALVGTAAALVWNGDQGIPIPGTTVRVRYRGRGFSHPALAQLEKQEHIPYSLGIQIGGPDAPWHEFGTHRLDVPDITFGLVADAMSLFSYIQDDSLWEEVTTAIGVSLWNNVVDRATLRGFAEFFETFTADQPELFARRSNRWVRHLVGAVIPMGLAQIDKQLSPAVKEVYGFLDQIVSRIPFQSESLDVREDVLGDPIERPRGYPPSISLFSPIPYKQVPGDPIRAELLKNEVGILPRPPYLFGANPDRTGPPDPREAIRLTTGRGSQYARLKELTTKTKLGGAVVGQTAGVAVPTKATGYTLKEALALVIQTEEYQKVLSAGRGGGQAKVLGNLIHAYQNAAQWLLLAEDQTLLHQYAAKSRSRGEALVNQDSLANRFKGAEAPPASSGIRNLTR